MPLCRGGSRSSPGRGRSFCSCFVLVLLARAGAGLAGGDAGTAAAPPAPAAPAEPAAQPEVWLLAIDGVINPAASRYLEQAVGQAAAASPGARPEALILRLDTPGGLVSSTREMTRQILGSAAPVVVFVAPPGARAASAGMFITLAAHVAAMAPGTNIGAAHPVSLGRGGGGPGGGGGADGGVDEQDVAADKAVADAAALARALAEERGRNVAWVERAVRESVALTASEARAENVVDLVAEDLADLLAQLDGRKIEVGREVRVLRTAGARVRQMPMSLPARILHTLADPNIAYILFTIGLLGLVTELLHPGLLLPGIAGAIALILAFLAFDSLPVSWAGLLLIALGVGLLVAEAFVPGFGALGLGGLLGFVLGSIILFDPLGGPPPPETGDMGVSYWLVGVMAALLALLLGLVLRYVIKARRGPVAMGRQALVGRVGVALRELDPVGPAGPVRLDSETWSARVEGGPVQAGEEVVVLGVEGVTLRVKKREGS